MCSKPVFIWQFVVVSKSWGELLPRIWSNRQLRMPRFVSIFIFSVYETLDLSIGLSLCRSSSKIRNIYLICASHYSNAELINRC
jgi:hypothetical protein